MTQGSWPGPLPDAPLSLQSLANLNLALVAAEISDSARGFFPFPDSRHDGTLFADAQRFYAWAEELVAAAILVERAHGVSWDDLADSVELAKSTVYKKWSPRETRWRQRLAEADQEALHEARPGRRDERMLGNSPETVAGRLNEWMARHATPGDLPRTSKPGTDLIARMAPLVESGWLATLRGRLLDNYLAPPPALMAPLAEREAELEDAWAQFMETGGRLKDAAEHRAIAAKNRAYAADLRRQAADGVAGSRWPESGDTGQDAGHVVPEEPVHER